MHLAVAWLFRWISKHDFPAVSQRWQTRQTTCMRAQGTPPTSCWPDGTRPPVGRRAWFGVKLRTQGRPTRAEEKSAALRMPDRNPPTPSAGLAAGSRAAADGGARCGALSVCCRTHARMRGVIGLPGDRRPGIVPAARGRRPEAARLTSRKIRALLDLRKPLVADLRRVAASNLLQPTSPTSTGTRTANARTSPRRPGQPGVVRPPR